MGWWAQWGPLVGVVVGAVLTFTFGLVTRWRESVRRHWEWTRDQQIAAYVHFWKVTSTLPRRDRDFRFGEDVEILTELQEAAGRIEMIGDESVVAAAQRVAQTFTELWEIFPTRVQTKATISTVPDEAKDFWSKKFDREEEKVVAIEKRLRDDAETLRLAVRASLNITTMQQPSRSPAESAASVRSHRARP